MAVRKIELRYSKSRPSFSSLSISVSVPYWATNYSPTYLPEARYGKPLAALLLRPRKVLARTSSLSPAIQSFRARRRHASYIVATQKRFLRIPSLNRMFHSNRFSRTNTLWDVSQLDISSITKIPTSTRLELFVISLTYTNK